MDQGKEKLARLSGYLLHADRHAALECRDARGSFRAHVTEPIAGSRVNPRRGRRIPASQPMGSPAAILAGLLHSRDPRRQR